MSIPYYGDSQQQADSVCFISYWHIPGGYQYDQARVCKQFFHNKELAEQVAEKYSMPPEMAVVIDIINKV